MKKLTFTSVFSQLLLLLFVIAWIVPTFGLFISSLRDKDVLAISGWWTSFTTTEVNEIYRTKGKEDQIKEGDYYFIKSNLFDENQGKEIIDLELPLRVLMNMRLVKLHYLKMKQKLQFLKMVIMFGNQKKSLKRKKGKEFLYQLRALQALHLIIIKRCFLKRD